MTRPGTAKLPGPRRVEEPMSWSPSPLAVPRASAVRTVVPGLLAFFVCVGAGCGAPDAPAASPPSSPPSPYSPPPPSLPPAPPAAPADTRPESCEAELHVCGPTWLGCVHVRAAGTTPEGHARFEGDDGVFYETRRDCGTDGRCTDHCPGGVCRPGVARVPDAPMVCSFLSGPPEPAPFACVLVDHACARGEEDSAAGTEPPSLPVDPSTVMGTS